MVLAYEPVLYHHGIKGQKWGVRRTKEQLKHDRGSIESVVNRGISKIAASHGVLISSISHHAAEQAEIRNMTSKELLDSLKNPLHISEVKIDDKGRKSIQYIGRYATSAVDPDNGVISSVWPTGHQRLNKYLKES